MGEAFGATGGGAAREELARLIGAAWTRSGCLAQERIEARLKSRFAGRSMRGLSDSSFNRYKDPEATALPDAEVLTALAELFGVGAEEAQQWGRLLDEARTEARRRRAAVRGTKGPSGPPPGAAGEASPVDPPEVSPRQPSPSTPSGPEVDATPDAVRVPAPGPAADAARVPAPGPAADAAPDSVLGPAQDAAPDSVLGPTPDASPDSVLGPAQDAAPDSVPGPAQDAVPVSPPGPAVATAPRADGRAELLPRHAQAPTPGRRPAGRRALVGAVALAAVVATWAVALLPSSPTGGGAPVAAEGGKAPEGPAGALPGPVGPPAVTGTAVPGPMTGDYRCGKVRAVEHAAWSACSQILDAGDTMRFAVRIDNPGSRAVTVRARLSWVRSRVVTPCPAPWGTGVRLTVPAGRSAVTPLDACPRRTTRPSAYQAMAWVIAETDMSWGERETSMTVHIHPDRYRWNDQLP